MTATFQSLQETREPKALKAVTLLGNLARYQHSEDEAKVMLNRLADAVDKADHAFAKKWGWTDDPIEQWTPEAEMRELSAVPQGTAEGGASFEAEIRWAIDALKRGDTKLAQNRLTRILKGETE